MKKLALLLLLSLTLPGCGLIPKRVEFFQDKVHRFPVTTEKQVELQREAAKKAADKAAETLHSALITGASTNVIAPAAETELLTEVVSQSVGQPASEPPADSEKLARQLRAQLAKHDSKVRNFAQDNDENAGKKIEGTGAIQIPYFAYAGGIVGAMFVGWLVLRDILRIAAAGSPAAAVGVGAMNLAGAAAGTAIKQLVKGGQEFKEWAQKNLEPAVHEKVLEAFTLLHKTAQDEGTQAVVDHLIK